MWVNKLTDSAGGYALDITNIRQDPSNAFDTSFDAALSYDASSADATITAVAECGSLTTATTTKTTLAADKSGSGFPNFNISVTAPPLQISIPIVDDATDEADETFTVNPVQRLCRDSRQPYKLHRDGHHPRR